ncbi:MAG: DUF4870 domain-containing protein [Microbacteriaceae bacterium]|nr:DUF4870 domain-containing protein [Microbacteriaceae bacterium]NBR77636.1 DUF4870 domain-containing protein [Microbacteriaceae bacterium]NBS86201.1 DUF4870 domain-containing protein [Micrococcales bacterium]NBX94566.1 DUF4870 domain-containing protein [Actinomycetota bacterium]
MPVCLTCQLEVPESQFCNNCGRPLAAEVRTTVGSNRASFVHWGPLALAASALLLQQAFPGEYWANLTQSTFLLGLLLSIFPLLLLWVPGLIILVSAKSSEFDKAHAKASLNNQISLFIYISIIMALFVGTTFNAFATGMPFGNAGPWLVLLVGLLLLSVAGICALVFSILGAAAAGSGKLYKYPLSIRFLK